MNAFVNSPPPSPSAQLGMADATLNEESLEDSLDMAKLAKLGAVLQGRFIQYESDRRMAEERWLRNTRQFLGEYDPDIQAQLGPNRSRAYPKLTRVKVVGMVARLMNLLFPTSEKNWSVEPSKVPNIPAEELQKILDQVAVDPNMDDDALDSLIKAEVVKFAKERSKNLSDEIEDQLSELGGSRLHDYVLLCRRVIMSGVLYGVGVMKGPFVRSVQLTTWERDPMTGRPVASTKEMFRPQFEHTSIWTYYPDMSAKTWDQMDGQFERHVMSRHQLSKLAKRPDFFAGVIKDYLKNNQSGNYKRRPYETELKTIGVNSNVNDMDGRKYEVIEWTGRESAHTMQAIGFDVPEDLLGEEVAINVWLLDNTVIKADIDPWIELVPEMDVAMYHHFDFEEDDTSIIGNGLPNVIRDSQMSVAATARMALDNGGVVCGPQMEANLDLLRQDQDLGNIGAYKVWYREGEGVDAQYPAIREIKIDSHVDELTKLMQTFMNFADMESFINPANGGDTQKMPSEPMRSPAGASMIRSDLALPFKDAVRNFDKFTLSVMNAMLAFNKALNPKPSIKGDFEVLAHGASSLVAKEVRGMQLDSYVMSLTPEEKMYVNMRGIAKERAAVRDLPLNEVLVSDDEAKRREEQQAQAAQRQQESTDQLLMGTVRKLLSESLKNLTQADKNATAAAVDEAQASVQAFATLEGDLNGTNKESAPGGAAAGNLE